MSRLYKVKYTWYESVEDKNFEENVLVIADSYNEVVNKITDMFEEEDLDSIEISFINHSTGLIYCPKEIIEQIVEENDY